MTTTFRFRGEQPPTETSRASLLADTCSDAGIATLYLYDPIDSWGGFWGVSAKEFALALAVLPADTSEIRLHLTAGRVEVEPDLEPARAARRAGYRGRRRDRRVGRVVHRRSR